MEQIIAGWYDSIPSSRAKVGNFECIVQYSKFHKMWETVVKCRGTSGRMGDMVNLLQGIAGCCYVVSSSKEGAQKVFHDFLQEQVRQSLAFLATVALEEKE